MGTVQGRPMRADARRNYERLLGEAAVAFAERGADASLEEIARRAGVGIGTLYRHFPDRFALMGEVFQTRVDELDAAARALAAEAGTPMGALAAWMRRYVDVSSTIRGIAATLMDEGLMVNCKEQLRETVELLASRARRSGELRADVAPDDLLRLTSAIAYAAEKASAKNPEDTEIADRLLGLALDGLRTRNA
ncbi:TetR/AcrR family transcriptional regulator [Streptomyces sp. CMB-StM0423]|uniref:TetR/AcrR family transcriptional regulator n=1 Tax=Streptomyces sp. CMB-StM0423 TaxID=2059884 RepID=UPI000C70C4C5|nr:TetR/AcrR family transcriptional regulator [Streptomyces sp. CMB-StM0423]AUH40976.1 TetR/AcrR family transcriptional regulator [Streptomyces sp. CMB-StM0423]